MVNGKLKVATMVAGTALAALLILSLLFITGRFGHPQSRTQMSAMGHHQSGTRSGSGVRTYYIAADQVAWDYAPSGKNQITGKSFDDVANVFVKNGPNRIGHVYLKSQYRQYTDAAFKHLKPRPPDEKYLGILGPVIRAEVGDTIKVVFKNKTLFPADMHPHGVFYNKDSEGAPYNDGTSGKDKSDDVVAPGKTHTYIWKVPKRAGPGPMDPSTVLWMYHGHVDEPADTNAGLIGPIIIGRSGSMKSDGTFEGVDREFITLFTVFDENESLYLKENIERYTGDPASANPEDEAFEESNLMHSINGYVYGNMPMPTMKKSEHVRWYLMSMGTDVAELLPMSMKVADMVPDNPGTWLYHCHVNDHIKAGMIARYEVLP